MVLPFLIGGYALYAGTSVRGVIWMVAFFLAVVGCVFLHEMGHAYAARRYGVSVFDILLLPIGGIARLKSLPARPSEEMWVALAGPLVNLFIALALLPALWYWPRHEWLPYLNNYDLGSALVCLSLFNAAVFVFNLIPAFPLDGGRILRAGLCQTMTRLKSTRITSWVSRIIGLSLLAYGIYEGSFFLMGFALFIFIIASREMGSAVVNAYLSDTMISSLAKDARAFDPVTPIDEIIEYLQRSKHGGAIIMDECCPIGFVNLRMLERLDEHTTHVGNLEMPTVICHDSNTPLREVSQQFSVFPRSIAIEENDGRPVGYLDLDLLDQGFQAFAKTV
jgi:Zn-dependent protease